MDVRQNVSTQKPRGAFEVRWWPNKHPDEVRRLYGHASEGVCGWYVVIDNGGGIEAPWSWGLGLSWVHPNSDLHGTFEQVLTPLDDEARRIMHAVQQNQRKYDEEVASHQRHVERLKTPGQDP